MACLRAALALPLPGDAWPTGTFRAFCPFRRLCSRARVWARRTKPRASLWRSATLPGRAVFVRKASPPSWITGRICPFSNRSALFPLRVKLPSAPSVLPTTPRLLPAPSRDRAPTANLLRPFPSRHWAVWRRPGFPFSILPARSMRNIGLSPSVSRRLAVPPSATRRAATPFGVAGRAARLPGVPQGCVGLLPREPRLLRRMLAVELPRHLRALPRCSSRPPRSLFRKKWPFFAIVEHREGGFRPIRIKPFALARMNFAFPQVTGERIFRTFPRRPLRRMTMRKKCAKSQKMAKKRETSSAGGLRSFRPKTSPEPPLNVSPNELPVSLLGAPSKAPPAKPPKVSPNALPMPPVSFSPPPPSAFPEVLPTPSLSALLGVSQAPFSRAFPRWSWSKVLGTAFIWKSLRNLLEYWDVLLRAQDSRVKIGKTPQTADYAPACVLACVSARLLACLRILTSECVRVGALAFGRLDA